MKTAFYILAAVALGFGLILLTPLGCRNGPGTTNGTVQMQLGGKKFTLEVADEPAERELGLMMRDSMPSDHGMIFVFPHEDRLSFWMKNTRIPLDIIYVDQGGKIVSIHQMRPYELLGTPSDAPAKYAIELNKGMAAKLGLKPGDQLTIPESARNVPSAQSNP